HQGVPDDRLIRRIKYHHFSPIGATFGNLISDQRAAFREGYACQRTCAILRKLVRIQEDLFFSIFTFLTPEYVLILKSIIFVEIDIISFSDRSAFFFIVP